MLPFIQFVVGTSLPAIVFRVAALLGIGVITYTGSTELIGFLADYLEDSINDVPDQIGDVLGLIRLDQYMSIIVSAYTLKITIMTTLGAAKRIGVR